MKSTILLGLGPGLLCSCMWIRDDVTLEVSTSDLGAELSKARRELDQWETDIRLAKDVFDEVDPSVLDCFHPSVTFMESKRGPVRLEGGLAKASTVLVMQGVLDRYRMKLDYAYDFDRELFRAIPAGDNTVFRADSMCAISSWITLDDIPEAVEASMQRFEGKVSSVLTIAAIVLDDECLTTLAQEKLAGAIADELRNDPIEKAALEEAIVQIAREHGSMPMT